MNDRAETGFETLMHDSAQDVDGVCDHFESAWQRGERLTIEDVLRLHEGDIASVLLRELVLLEIGLRLRAGEKPQRGDYAERFSSLSDSWLHCALKQSGTKLAQEASRSETKSDAPPEIPGFELLGELGRGGMGVVYKALDLRLGRTVALKVLPIQAARNPRRLELFRREARAACALNHPAVCTLFDVGEHNGQPFLVLEWIDGETLREHCRTRPGLNNLLPLFRQVAGALRAAHAAGIVHRDIKPENLMVRHDGYVKVLDFGLARLLTVPDEPGSSEIEVERELLLGTVNYMSPEQARIDRIECSTDLFSLGIVLYELATGRHPFAGRTAFESLQAIATRQPMPPSVLNPEAAPLNILMLQMLDKDPQNRPTAAELEVVFGELAGSGGVGRAESGPPRQRLYVGRHEEREALFSGFAAAAAGSGSMLCVTGEPGIGKTTLVESFLTELSGRGACGASGHCADRVGGAETYLPVLEALAQLIRGEAGESAARSLRLLAPSWCEQVVPLAHGGHATPARFSSQEHRKQELFAFLQELSRHRPIVLVFDDVHWADVSTVDLLAHLGGRCAELRLLLVVTYRPTELLVAGHPFRQVMLDLQGRNLCREIRLAYLGRRDVEAYLALAFPGHAFPPDFVEAICARTEGNPLFVADLLRDLRERGVISECGGRWMLAQPFPELGTELPESLRGLISRQFDRLSRDDRRLLEVASVQGHEFESAAIAEALDCDAADVEERLQELDRVHGLVRLVREHEFPDRTLTLRYSFVHVLYQNVLFEALPPSRRMSWSAAIAGVLARHHRDPTPAVAAELACLYETARDYAKASDYFLLAARNAAQVFAHREAVVLARRGLRLLQAVPETPERADRELALQTTLGMQLQTTKGFAAPSAKQAYSRARELCRQCDETPHHFPVLWGLWLFHKVRSELPKALEMADDLLRLAQHVNNTALILQSHQAQAVTHLCLGEPKAVCEHMEQGTALYDPEQHKSHTSLFGQDPCVACQSFGAIALWLLGYADRAVEVSRDAVRLSHELTQPSSQALALHFASMLRQFRREGEESLALAQLSIAMSALHSLSFWHAGGTVLSGWAKVDCGDITGIALLQKGLKDWQATGSVTYRTYYLALLADVLGRNGQTESALSAIDEALVLAESTSEQFFAAELHRIKGDLLPASAEAERSLRKAIDLARSQEARSLELRALVSLARYLRTQDRMAEVMPELEAIFGWFTEGFDNPDLVEAKKLLVDCAKSS